ncbi:MAG: SDR family oxidoreductase [Myxococcales bacterium]|nr:SDR family oxidoreductase [Myxococcales bacterium]
MKSFSNKVAAITGAASGIGRALALSLAEEGAQLALSDVDELRLAETRREVEGRAIAVSSTQLDVADRDAVHRWADDVVAQHGAVHLVFNNAGVGFFDTLDGTKYEDLEWLMNINFWGVVYGSKAFLPHLERSGEGHIVNISSVFGIISVPGQTAYNAAKFAVRGFSEALAQELELTGKPVGVTSVHPGGIATNIVKAGRFGRDAGLFGGREALVQDFQNRLARTSPDQCAKTILDGVRRGRRRVLVGLDAHVIDIVQRLLPVSYQRIIVAMMKRERSRA